MTSDMLIKKEWRGTFSVLFRVVDGVDAEEGLGILGGSLCGKCLISERGNPHFFRTRKLAWFGTRIWHGFSKVF